MIWLGVSSPVLFLYDPDWSSNKKKKTAKKKDMQTGDEGINNFVFAYMFLELYWRDEMNTIFSENYSHHWCIDDWDWERHLTLSHRC